MSNENYPYDREALRATLRTLDQVPGVAKPDPIMTVDNIERRFGGMVAVDVKHLEVQRGAITALIGPNGAGKTTFFNLITGFDQPSNAQKLIGGGDASWSFNGKTLNRTSASQAARVGMVRTFQLTKALSRMTVMENMLIGANNQPGENLFVGLIKPLWAARERENIERANDLLQRFKLDAKKDDMAGDLSGGQMIAKRVAKQHGLDRDGIAFYDFEALGSLVDFKNEYRASLDALGAGLDEQEQSRMLDEVRAAYAFNTAVFIDLGKARDTVAA